MTRHTASSKILACTSGQKPGGGMQLLGRAIGGIRPVAAAIDGWQGAP